jgi:hypothetical protein
MTRVAAGFGALVALLLAPDPAWGGCGNVCELNEPQVTVEPALECTWAETRMNECGCSVRLMVHNECATPIEARDFQFDSCGSPSVPSTLDCTTLAHKITGDFELRFGENGRHEETFTLREGGVDHVLTVRVDVHSIDDGEMCSVGRVGRRGASQGGFLVGVGAVVLLTRRVRFMNGRVPRSRRTPGALRF